MNTIQTQIPRRCGQIGQRSQRDAEAMAEEVEMGNAALELIDEGKKIDGCGLPFEKGGVEREAIVFRGLDHAPFAPMIPPVSGCRDLFAKSKFLAASFREQEAAT